MLTGPIFVRELRTTPRRGQHYVLRASFTGLLFVVMWTAWQALVGFEPLVSLGSLAAFHAILFEVFAVMQLVLVLFASSLYGAGSVSYEKDRRTFILLLMTRLTDEQIVLEKFAAALLQVGALVACGVPVFLLTALLGGVGFDRIAEVYAVTVATTVLGAAVGVFIACWRDRSFQSLALTILTVALALVVMEGLIAALPAGRTTRLTVGDWLAAASPLRALASALGDDQANPLPLVGRASFAFVALAGVVAAALLTWAILRLRAWNPRGEPLQQRETAQDTANPAEPARDPFRRIWNNPVLWREMRTRAYGTRPVLIKLAYLVFAVLIVGSLLLAVQSADPGTEVWLGHYLVPLAVVSLLLINTQAVTAVTTEQDLRSLDLLLVTEITPRQFVFGKLWGILWNVKEMIAAPIVLVALGVVSRLIDPDAAFYAATAFLVGVVFVTVLGIHAAMRHETTRVSMANSLATTFLLFVGMLLCLFLILISPRFEAQWTSFILFIVFGSIGLWVSLSANHPTTAIGWTAALAPVATFYCLIALVVGGRIAPWLVGAGVYTFAILSMLIPLLSEFDVATGRTTAGEG